jgi:carbonic anhydrase/acetyltransferase-like protein (isoleucine patch superfamily)
VPKINGVTAFDGHMPVIAPDVFVDISARIIGRVTLEQGSSIWPGAVLRADEEAISVGADSAVLDLCLIEAPTGHPVRIEPGAIVSHSACVHGATIKRGALVGIGAIVLDGAIVGEGALVGAGALVPPGMEIPPGMLVLGQPGKAIRELKPGERDNIAAQVAELRAKAKRYLDQNQV